jgi:hypothetical protein
MEVLLKFFPATVFVALILFVTKEVIEFFRRKNADKRKIEALHVLLAAECERNHWTIKSLRNASHAIADALTVDKDVVIQESINKNGWMSFRRSMMGHWGSNSVTPVHKSIQERHLADAALLDKRLFDAMREAYDAALEMDHVRTGLYDCVSQRNLGEDDHLDGFDRYAKSELESIYIRINALYEICTGQKLEKHRVI